MYSFLLARAQKCEYFYDIHVCVSPILTQLYYGAILLLQAKLLFHSDRHETIVCEKERKMLMYKLVMGFLEFLNKLLSPDFVIWSILLV
jgi:hypothetical protein